MNKQLESLLERAAAWPEAAQDEAVRVLTAIERKYAPLNETEREAKLAALRDTINRSIERGGSFTDEEVAASIEARLDAWERKRKGA
jgi:hypothetical protein